MYPIVKFYSNEAGEILKFLNKYYESTSFISDLKECPTSMLEWEKKFDNPIEIVSLLGVFVDNLDTYNMVMWLCLDKGAFIKITPNNADNIIRYLYERYPY